MYTKSDIFFLVSRLELYFFKTRLSQAKKEENYMVSGVEKVKRGSLTLTGCI